MNPNTEILLTLAELKGIGNKSIFKICESIKDDVKDINNLVRCWKSLKGKNYNKITDTDLRNANLSAQNIMERCKDEGIGIISYYEEIFPQNLRNCLDEEGKPSPPLLLYYRGDINALKKPGVAIIGSREPTKNGFNAGMYFSNEFAKEGFNIVSGLAIGCDESAHKGALEAGGVTTAFLAHGLNWELTYPKDNLKLAHDIVENGGLLLSEYKPGTYGNKYYFVERDRLQAALAYATIVVQTGIRGGTMHAVRATMVSKKPLFAIKFNHDADLSKDVTKGNESLIDDGSAIALSRATINEAIQIVRNELPDIDKKVDKQAQKKDIAIQQSLFQ